MSSPRPSTVALSLALLCAIWGSTYLVIREGLSDLPPFLAAATRFAVATAILAVVAPPLARREGGARPTLALSCVMGVLNVAVAYGLVYHSETVLPSGLVSVLWSTNPLLMALSGHLFLPGERLAPRQALGFLVGFAGVALLFVTDLGTLRPEAPRAGALLLLSPLSVAIGTTILKRRASGTSSVLLNRNGMAIGAVLLFALARTCERDAPAVWSVRAIASVLYLAVVGTVVAFGLYYWLLRSARASRLSLIAYVIPVVALTLGSLLGGEPFRRQTFLGAATVLLGVALVHAGRHRTRAG